MDAGTRAAPDRLLGVVAGVEAEAAVTQAVVDLEDLVEGTLEVVGLEEAGEEQGTRIRE